MPLYFSQVRDAVAYSRVPEQDGVILAIYVSDMAALGATWEEAGITNWIPLETALFVVGSSIKCGMRAPELVSFSDLDAAEALTADQGGAVMALSVTTDSDVIAPVAPGDIGAEDEPTTTSA